MIGVVYSLPQRESCQTMDDNRGHYDTLESKFGKYFTSCYVMY